VGVLGVFAFHDLIQVHDTHRHLRPADLLAGGNTPGPGNQRAVRTDDDRVQQADLGDACGQGIDVAEVLAVALVDRDVGDVGGDGVR